MPIAEPDDDEEVEEEEVDRNGGNERLFIKVTSLLSEGVQPQYISIKRNGLNQTVGRGVLPQAPFTILEAGDKPATLPIDQATLDYDEAFKVMPRHLLHLQALPGKDDHLELMVWHGVPTKGQPRCRRAFRGSKQPISTESTTWSATHGKLCIDWRNKNQPEWKEALELELLSGARGHCERRLAAQADLGRLLQRARPLPISMSYKRLSRRHPTLASTTALRRFRRCTAARRFSRRRRRPRLAEPTSGRR